MNKEHKRLLKENFESAVNAYVDAFLELFELGKSDTWWGRDRIGRDLFFFNDLHAISLDDIILCVEEGIKYDVFLEYEEYNVKCLDYNLSTMNLEAWWNEAPRHDFSELDALKKDLEDAIKNEKEKF